MRDTILIVDDEADIVSTLADYFLYNDYNVMTATSGTEAIEKAERQPDIILLDINMPDVDVWRCVPGYGILFVVPFFS